MRRRNRIPNRHRRTNRAAKASNARMETLSLSVLRVMESGSWVSVPEIRRRSDSRVSGDEVRWILRALRRHDYVEKGIDPQTNRPVYRYVAS